MTKLLNIALALSSLVFVSAARAEGDLVALWRAAAEHNPDYAATLAQGEADQQKRGQAAALNSPQLLLGVGARYQTTERNVSGARFSSPAFGTQTGVDFDARIDPALRRCRLDDLPAKPASRLARRAVAAADPIGSAAALETWLRRCR